MEPRGRRREEGAPGQGQPAANRASPPSPACRNALMFNNELMADVHFIVGPPGASKKVPAHKVCADGFWLFNAAVVQVAFSPCLTTRLHLFFFPNYSSCLIPEVIDMHCKLKGAV